eukprot:354459-Chlamydomonas_euryale.AAC.5
MRHACPLPCILPHLGGAVGRAWFLPDGQLPANARGDVEVDEAPTAVWELEHVQRFDVAVQPAVAVELRDRGGKVAPSAADLPSQRWVQRWTIQVGNPSGWGGQPGVRGGGQSKCEGRRTIQV